MNHRNSPNREIVWEILHSTPHALCHEDILQRCEKHLDRVTVYRILQRLCDEGMAHKIVDTSGKTFYSPCHTGRCEAHHHSDHHLHFKCTECDRIVCLPEEFVPTLPARYDFQQVNCLVEGICPECHS